MQLAQVGFDIIHKSIPCKVPINDDGVCSILLKL